MDGRPLDGVRSVRVLQDTDFESDGRTIRCTEVRAAPERNQRLQRSVSLSHSGARVDVPAGVLPAQNSGPQPRVGAVVLQRLPEGNRPGGLQRPDASSRRSRLRWHQLALSPHLNAG